MRLLRLIGAGDRLLSRPVARYADDDLTLYRQHPLQAEATLAEAAANAQRARDLQATGALSTITATGGSTDRRNHLPAFCIRCPLLHVRFQRVQILLDLIRFCHGLEFDGCHPSPRR